MATTPTNLPVPSESPRDLKFNAGKIDEFVTSLAHSYIDRFGNEHYTIEGLRWLIQQAILQYGWIPVGTFQDGATLTLPNQILKDETDGEYYRWDGELPKLVPAGSTPSSTGGVGPGAWLSIGDAVLRSALAGIDGYSFIGELKSVADFFGLVKQDGAGVKLRSWYAGSNVGGGFFYFDASTPKSKHDGGKYISPTVPYVNSNDFVSGIGETNPDSSGVWVRSDITDELRTEWYGLLDGTDGTAILSKIALTAGEDGHGITVSPGDFTLSGQVLLLADSSPTGKVKFLRGAGRRLTRFIVDVNTIGTAPSLEVRGSIGTSTEQSDYFLMHGFRMSGNGTDSQLNRYTGTGPYMRNLHGFKFYDLHIENLNRSILLENSLYGHIENCRFNQNREGFVMRRSGLNTGANAIQFTRCDFADHLVYCVHAIESHSIKFQTCAFEGNGSRKNPDGSPIPGTACVQTNASGASGGIVASYDNCYFEANRFADIIHIVDINRNQLVSITNCSFNKGGDGYTNARVLVVCQLTSTNTKATLHMQNNKFLNGAGSSYVPYPDIVFSGFPDLVPDAQEFLDYDNYFSSATPISKMPYTVHKKAPDDGFIARISSAGVITGALSRNIITCQRTAVGVYRIITNQIVASRMTFNVELDNLGFVLISTSENNQALTVSTFNGAGTAADVAFRMIGKLV
ncbi:right-handed parallel beta-helix repeat-containing protein [Citrobacter farmeri]